MSRPEVVIIDLALGNSSSIANMVRHVGGNAIRSADPEVVGAAKRLILPGVGAFDEGMRRLNASGLRTVLDAQVLERRTPVLGICLGMQLMTHGSEEGVLPGLGWVPGRTRRFAFQPNKPVLRIPHIGWAPVEFREGTPLGEAMPAESRFYFVHSYHAGLDREDAHWLCRANYGYTFVAGFGDRNITGVQFHPEKSHRFGMQLFRNFLRHPAPV